jgi:ABC-type bacteriocin/lantibiotic exporter with double-glycine peptidase domain
MGILVSLGLSITTSSKSSGSLDFILQYVGVQTITQQQLLPLCGAGVVVLLLIRTGLSLFISLKTYRFLAKLGGEVSATFIAKLLSSPFWWIRNQSVNELSFALTQGVQYSIIGVLGQFIILISELSFLILMLMVLVSVNPLMALVAVIFFFSFGLLVYLQVGRHISNLSEKTTEKIIEGNQQIQNSLNLFREIFTKSREKAFEDEFRDSRYESGMLFAQLNWLQLVPKFAVEVAVVLGAFFLALASALTGGYVSAVTDLAVFLAATSRIAPSALRLQQSMMSTRSYAGQSLKSFEYYHELVTLQSSESEIKSGINSGLSYIPRVNFDEVSYKFVDSSTPVLENISFTISAGETVALVGSSGSGKSTLCDLFLGLHTPTSGSALIDGVPSNEFVKSHPGCISYLPQETLIIPGTISENIAIGVDSKDLDQQELSQAIIKSQLVEFIGTLPGGLAQSLGEIGLKLSGGQKQRIGLARALYARPKLLVLDEPTSSLDAETEDAFLRALKVMQGECSVLIIAHRLSTLKFVDRVMYLENGRILATGSVADVRRAVPRFDVQAGLQGL